MVGGALLHLPRDRFGRGLGKQFAVWGFIDALIAVFGDRDAKNRATKLTALQATEILESERKKLDSSNHSALPVSD